METTFTRAECGDIDVLLEFMGEYYEFDHLPFDAHSARSALEQLLGDATLGQVWLIHHRGVAAGYIVLTLGYSLEYGGRDAFIDEVYLRASHRGHGVGASALAFIEGVCRALDVRALHREVERQNTRAHGVYRKVGFVDHDRYLMTKRMISG